VPDAALPTDLRIIVAGRGPVGRSLAGAFRASGLAVALVPGRSLALPTEPVPGPALLFLAVPDGAVLEVAEKLARDSGVSTATAVIHLSGALGLGPLEPLAGLGYATGSFHPLQPFPEERPPATFRDALIAVDASEPVLLERLCSLATLLGARSRQVGDAQRATYHAAAVMAANLLVALADQASQTLQRIGWSPDEALQGVLSLMHGSLDALDSLGLPGALSGPVSRGDWATIEHHLHALEQTGGHTAGVYRELSLAAADVARRRGLPPETAARIEQILNAVKMPSAPPRSIS
jgi:predicted short-subunit dehydrogenase-like oxidoreductase (DUF2520 family)